MWFTVATLASFLGINAKTIYKMADRGEIPHYRLRPHLIRFKQEEIETWLAAKAVTTTEHKEKAGQLVVYRGKILIRKAANHSTKGGETK